MTGAVRRLALAPALLFALPALPGAGSAAHADVLVSNISQEGQGAALFSLDQAQAFTTGMAEGGYTITSVELQVPSYTVTGETAEFTVSINTSNGGVPGNRLGSLRAPASLRVGVNKFTHSGINLDVDTTYFVVLDVSRYGEGALRNTRSDQETGAQDWSIADVSLERDFDSTGSWRTITRSRKIRINGGVTGDALPTFGDSTISDQTYTQHAQIGTLNLPAATGGDGSLSYTLDRTLPAGLTLDSANRRITGTPTAAQAATIYTWTATDSDGDFACLTFNITVSANALPTFGESTIPDQTYTQNTRIGTLNLPAATGGDGSLSYTLDGTLPAGLTLDSANRRITGTPTAVQAATSYTWKATDSDGDFASLTFSITVSAPAGLPVASVAWTNSEVTEGAHLELTVSLSQPAPEGGLVVRVNVDDAPHDVLHPDSHWNRTGLTIPAGATQASFHPQTVDDIDDEPTGTVRAEVQSGTGYSGAGNAAEIDVLDNDPPRLATIVPVSSSVTAGAPAKFTVRLSNPAPAGGGLSMSLDVSEGQGGDFVAPGEEGRKVLSFSGGDTEKEFTVPTRSSGSANGSVQVSLAVGSGSSRGVGYTLGSPSSATVTVTPGTAIPSLPTVSLSATPNPVDEGSSVTVTARLSRPLANDLTVPLIVVSETAEPGDYGPLADIRIAAGSSSGTGTITTADDADTANETFTVSLGTLPSSVTAGSPSSVTVTIRDDDAVPPPPSPSRSPARVSLSATPNPVDEGSSVAVTARLSRPLPSDITVLLTLRADSAEPGDFGPLASIRIDAGSTSGTGTITANQDADYDDETFTVSLGTLPSSVRAGTPSSVTVTIRDDDSPPAPSASLSAMPNPVAEGSSVTVTARLSRALPHGVTVPLTLTLGSAEPGDFGPPLGGIRIDAGSTSGTGTITANQDADYDDETFTVSLGTLPSSMTAGSPSSVTVTISDDDTPPPPPPVRLSAAPNPVDEGSSVTVTAQLSHPLPHSVTLPLILVADSAEPDDYGPLASIRIDAGSTAGTGTITTTDDADSDNETLIVYLGALPPSVVVGSPSSVTVTINDDDPPPPPPLQFGTGSVRDQSWTQNQRVRPLTLPAATGGVGTLRYELTPELPAGVTLASATRRITGTPSVSLARTTYTWKATDTAGDSVSLTFAIRVAADSKPTFGSKTIPDQSYTQHRQIAPLALPSATGGDGTLRYSLEGTLPPGLILNSATRQLTGVPIATQGAATYTWRATDADGDSVALTFSIKVSADPTLEGWLVRMGRTFGGQVVDALSARFEGGAMTYGTLGGANLGAGGRDDGSGYSRPQHVGPGEPDWQTRSTTAGDLLRGTAFHLSGDERDTSKPGFAAWGRFAGSRFGGESDGVTMSGDVTTGFVAADVEWRRALAGVLVSHTRSNGFYGGSGRGDVESSLTGLFPYARLRVSERVSAWGVTGMGVGKITNEPDGQGPTETDVTLRMGAVGVSGRVLDGASGFGVNLKSDAMWVSTESDPAGGPETAQGSLAGGLAATQSDVTRFRLLLEGERAFEFGNGATFTPSAEAGLRMDGGEAETGMGMEVGTGARIAAGRLVIEGEARGLVTHADSGLEEWGASATVRLDPDSTGRGASLSLSPVWGNASGGAEQLWSARDPGALGTAGVFDAESRLDGEFGYGLALADAPGVLTPYAGITTGQGGTRMWRAGARWAMALAATMELEAARRKSASANRAEHGVRLRVAIRW